MSSNAETEKVEKSNAQGDDDTRPQDRGILNHLVPTTGKVKESRTGGPCSDDGHEDDNGSCPKEPFETDSVERSDGVLFHYLFFDDELGRSADRKGENGW